MTHYEQRRTRTIDTPLGPETIEERKWNEGEDDEHWAYNQDLKAAFNYEEDTPNGHIVGELLRQYTVAQELTSDGYEFHSMLEPGTIFWINYTNSTSNDSTTNQN
jgi:hypothetical protein